MSHHPAAPCTLAPVLALVLAAPAARADEAKKGYTDERYGFSLTVPSPWSDAPLGTFSVPGVARAAWTGPKGASIVAFVQEPGRAYSPRVLLDASARAFEETLKAKVSVREVRPVAGKRAMWMVATGPGTGAAIVAGGAVETTQHWVAVPREKDVIVFLLTCPATEYPALRPAFEEAVGSAVIRGSQTAEQAEAK